jgi:hypothetical protein
MAYYHKAQAAYATQPLNLFVQELDSKQQLFRCLFSENVTSLSPQQADYRRRVFTYIEREGAKLSVELRREHYRQKQRHLREKRGDWDTLTRAFRHSDSDLHAALAAVSKALVPVFIDPRSDAMEALLVREAAPRSFAAFLVKMPGVPRQTFLHAVFELWKYYGRRTTPGVILAVLLPHLRDTMFMDAPHNQSDLYRRMVAGTIRLVGYVSIAATTGLWPSFRDDGAFEACREALRASFDKRHSLLGRRHTQPTLATRRRMAINFDMRAVSLSMLTRWGEHVPVRMHMAGAAGGDLFAVPQCEHIASLYSDVAGDLTVGRVLSDWRASLGDKRHDGQAEMDAHEMKLLGFAARDAASPPAQLAAVTLLRQHYGLPLAGEAHALFDADASYTPDDAAALAARLSLMSKPRETEAADDPLAALTGAVEEVVKRREIGEPEGDTDVTVHESAVSQGSAVAQGSAACAAVPLDVIPPWIPRKA